MVLKESIKLGIHSTPVLLFLSKTENANESLDILHSRKSSLGSP